MTPFDVNIAHTLRQRAIEQPYQEAVIVPSGRDRAGRVTYAHLTYAQLDALSEQVARGLLSHGITPGMHTAFMVKPSIEFFVLTFALFKARAVPVLIDPGIGIRNIRRCLAEAEAEAFVGIPAAHLARVLFRWRGAGWKKLVSISKGRGWGRITYHDLLEAGAQAGAPHATRARVDEVAAILFTSGSTGAPKGAVYTHGNFQAQVRLLAQSLHIKPGERDLCTFPLFALFAPALGMSAVIPEMDFTRPAQVDPEKIREAIENFGISNMFGSPALIRRVAEYGNLQGWRFPSLKRVISAGAPVPATVIASFRQLIEDDCLFVTPYGATESLPVAIAESRLILDETRHDTAHGRGICVGHPVPETDVRILRITDHALPRLHQDDLLRPGHIGEIIVSGHQVTHRYFNREEATQAGKILGTEGQNLFHRMGDLGYFDEQGRLWFCGRKSQRVITREGDMYTINCEGVFNQHPGVARTALVGMGQAPEQIPALCVELKKVIRDPAERDQLLKDLRAIALRFPHTKSIEHFFIHAGFPVDIRHNAKIFREKLKPWAEAQWQKGSWSPAAAASWDRPSSDNSSSAAIASKP